jgi:hypothetical protein
MFLLIFQVRRFPEFSPSLLKNAKGKKSINLGRYRILVQLSNASFTDILSFSSFLHSFFFLPFFRSQYLPTIDQSAISVV